jgi:SNF2 family DNA or RNA helicase
MIRRLKSEVLAELPPKKRSTITLEISPANMAEYKKVAGDKLDKSRLTELYSMTAAAKVMNTSFCTN